MDYNMVISYDYVQQKKTSAKNECTSFAGRFDGHASMLDQYNGIARCSKSRATLEATGCRHQVTTCSVLPWRPPGRQQTKQR
jgi:hypothetical protein